METAYYKSTFGTFEIKGTTLGIQSVKLVDKVERTTLDAIPELQACIEQLDEYFNQKRQDFDLKLDWADASVFYKKVWAALLEIPYGRTASYSSIAVKIGDKKAVRAIGLANKNNPIAIIVPCHRVIAKSGKLQGYFYGLDMKRQLLELENPMSFAQQATLF